MKTIFLSLFLFCSYGLFGDTPDSLTIKQKLDSMYHYTMSFEIGCSLKMNPGSASDSSYFDISIDKLEDIHDSIEMIMSEIHSYILLSRKETRKYIRFDDFHNAYMDHLAVYEIFLETKKNY